MLPVCCVPVWTMGRGQRADLSIITKAWPSFPLSCHHSKVLVKKRARLHLTWVHHHSPLAAWSLSSLPFVFPLMELHRRGCSCWKSNFGWELQGHGFTFSSSSVFFFLFLYGSLKSRPLSVPSLLLWVPLCLALHSPTPFVKPLLF